MKFNKKILLFFLLFFVTIPESFSFDLFNWGKPDISIPTHVIQNEFIKIGITKEAGGAINYFSTAQESKNWINTYDHGRFIQLSLYGSDDDSYWPGSPASNKRWAYNPVQGGDYKGKASKILEIKAEGNRLYVKLIPRHWASGKLLEDMLFEQTITLNKHVAEIEYIATYLGDKNHDVKDQELPAIFLDSSLSTLIYDDKEGKEQSIGPTFPNLYAEVSHHFAAYVLKDFGVGLYFPHADKITFYRVKDGRYACSYLAPITQFSITRGLSKSWKIYLAIGSLKELRERFSYL